MQTLQISAPRRSIAPVQQARGGASTMSPPAARPAAAATRQPWGNGGTESSLSPRTPRHSLPRDPRSRGALRDARRKDAVASAVPTLPLGTESHRLPGLPAGDACQGWIFCSSPFHVNYQRAANVSSLLPALSARRLLLAGLPCKKRAPQPWGGVGAWDPSRCCLALQTRCILLSWDGQEDRHIC